MGHGISIQEGDPERRMQSRAHLLKKHSPSGEVTLYIASRDYIDHYKQIDPIDGVVAVPLDKVHGKRLFVELQVHFRYGAESEEFTDVPFKKEAVLVACELFPFGNPPGQAETTPHAVNNWQTALCKKYGDSMAVLPFTLKFPQGTPPSLILMGPPGVKGEPCGLTYHVIAFSCTDPSLPLLRSNTVGFNVRILQETLRLSVLEGLSLTPTTRPAVSVSRQFFLSPGRILIEMCLDRAVVYYGDKVAMHVVITNSSNRNIRKIKCKMYQVSQLSFSSGIRRVPIFCLETTEGCPIQPGASLQRSYTLTAVQQPQLSMENLVFEAPSGRPDDPPGRLAATTLFPYTDPKQGFALLVTFEAKIKVYLGSPHAGFGDVSASVPFFLFHQPDDNKEGSVEWGDEGVNAVPSAVRPAPRMIRLTSVDNQVDEWKSSSSKEPLLIW